ncbi:MAG: NADH/ubiquinone/plastoquinone [Acidobacteria bacterium RIFCSPLOWO2_02_FULL_59_13]|nr:MAG: NADH/ubiquinone/plastoquinone [Acidobacteria bacterium RIFCSPLOWO2_02_FULL_59_13]
MKWLLVLPLLIPLAAAAVSLLAWRWPHWQQRLSSVGAVAMLATGIALLENVRRGGIQAVQIGDWPAPFGITLVADLFSAIMVVIAGLVGTAVTFYSHASVDWRRQSFGYYPLLQILLMGVCGAFLTGDVFNLYVWFEVMLIASFVLMALGGERAQMEGAMKYVTLNLVSSAFFLAAVGILYGVVGTLNMADLAQKVPHIRPQVLVTAVAMLFLVAFGIKAAAFPLFFWLPASYHTPPVAVSAIFAGLLTKVGVYALIRVFTLIFVTDTGYTHTWILVLSGLTMVTGVLGAVAQNEFRRILSFHIISQIGYMIMGLGLYTPLALAASVFYIVHHIIVKTNLFLVSGIANSLRGTYQLKQLGGLYRDHPGLAFLFLVPAFSLAGVPPLSGFFAKLALIQAGLEVGQYFIVATALGVSLLTLFSMIKIWTEAFWKPEPATEKVLLADEPETARQTRPPALTLWVPVVVLAALTVILGLAAEPFLSLALQASQQLMNPAGYIEAVLGSQP